MALVRQEEWTTWFELTIYEAKNQQFRRMGDATGFKVMRLARTGVAGVSTTGLPRGTGRYLTSDELRPLKQTHGVPNKIPHADAERAPEGGASIHV